MKNEAFRKQRKTFLTVLFLVVLLPVIGADSESRFIEKGFLYKAEKEGKTFWLYGSIHLADAAAYPLDAKVLRYFAAAEALALEIDPHKIAEEEVTNALIRHARLPGSLKKRLGKKLYTQFNQYALSQGLNIALFSDYRPWFIALMLDELQEQSALTSELGIDNWFIRTAAEKPVCGLETFDEQLAAFAALSVKEERRLFEKALARLTYENYTDIQQVYEFWLYGNAEALEQLIGKSFDPVAKLERSLLINRSLMMVERLEEMLASYDTVFFVVGAAHLLGEEGLPALFERRGYVVERI